MEPAQSRSARQRHAILRNAQLLVALNFRVPFEFRQRIKLAATMRGVTMTALVTDALEKYLSAQ
jgi:hypothetical protein